MATVKEVLQAQIEFKQRKDVEYLMENSQNIEELKRAHLEKEEASKLQGQGPGMGGALLGRLNDAATTQQYGSVGSAISNSRETLEGRLGRVRRDSEHVTKELSRLEELHLLLDHNPDTARILYLLNLLNF